MELIKVEKEWIKDNSNITELYNFRNDVFRSRMEPFHWDQNICLECWTKSDLHNEHTDIKVR